MRNIDFAKIVASGNDFIIIKNNPQSKLYISPRILSRKMCDRRFGVGADGLLIFGKSKITDVKMRIFNPDGSEAEMCGNGARCAALYVKRGYVTLETKAGIIESRVNGNDVKIKLTDPQDIKLDIPIKINSCSRPLRANFINTGVPHTVIFVEGLNKIDVVNLGRQIRYHKNFSPKGTNVNFVEVLGNNSIKIRTYERGVENETLACGTGSVASALIFALKSKTNANGSGSGSGSGKIKVHTQSQEVLTVYFTKLKQKFSDVWLEGKARIVFNGRFIYG